MFIVTASAAEQILLAARTQPDAADPPLLRIAAKFGDHGEIVYGMGFDDQREHDAVTESAGIVVLIAPRSLELLKGTTLDFVELHPGEFQFIFINPHEAPSCGAGSGGNGGGGHSGCGSCGSRGSC